MLEEEASMVWIHVERHSTPAIDCAVSASSDGIRARLLASAFASTNGCGTPRCRVHFQQPAVPDLQPMLAVNPLLAAEETSDHRRRPPPPPAD